MKWAHLNNNATLIFKHPQLLVPCISDCEKVTAFFIVKLEKAAFDSVFTVIAVQLQIRMNTGYPCAHMVAFPSAAPNKQLSMAQTAFLKYLRINVHHTKLANVQISLGTFLPQSGSLL
jgi:hypothetical protein